MVSNFVNNESTGQQFSLLGECGGWHRIAPGRYGRDYRNTRETAGDARNSIGDKTDVVAIE